MRGIHGKWNGISVISLFGIMDEGEQEPVIRSRAVRHTGDAHYAISASPQGLEHGRSKQWRRWDSWRNGELHGFDKHGALSASYRLSIWLAWSRYCDFSVHQFGQQGVAQVFKCADFLTIRLFFYKK